MIQEIEMEIPSKLKTDIGIARLSNASHRYGIKYHGRWMPLHKAIYLEAYGEIPNGYQIHHLDNNRFNNRANNLVALTVEEHRKIHENLPKNHYKFVVAREIKREVLFEFEETPLRKEVMVKVNLMRKITSLKNILKCLEDEEPFDEDEENLKWLEAKLVIL